MSNITNEDGSFTVPDNLEPRVIGIRLYMDGADGDKIKLKHLDGTITVLDDLDPKYKKAIIDGYLAGKGIDKLDDE